MFRVITLCVALLAFAAATSAQRATDPSIEFAKELHDFGKGRGGDGMAIDSQDRLYVTAGANRPYANQNTDNPAGVYVFSPQGKLLGVIPVPEDMVTNCCFGGEDGKTLFITAGKTLWRIQVK